MQNILLSMLMVSRKKRSTHWNFMRERASLPLYHGRFHIQRVLESQIWYRGQSVRIQDCLYRNMGSFQHLAFIDIDEYIIPRVSGHVTWRDLVRDVEVGQGDKMAEYCFSSTFFYRQQALRGVCWQLNCTQRMELYSKENMKY